MQSIEPHKAARQYPLSRQFHSAPAIGNQIEPTHSSLANFESLVSITESFSSCSKGRILQIESASAEFRTCLQFAPRISELPLDLEEVHKKASATIWSSPVHMITTMFHAIQELAFHPQARRSFRRA
jgi:hypothetical protein